MRGPGRVAMGGLALSLLLSSCTFVADDPQPPTSESRPAGDTPNVLPDFCDGLVSTLMVASVVQHELRGGRTAEYAAPDDEPGLTAGMTCREGVDDRGASLTVSASAFTDEELARSALQRAARTQSPRGTGIASADRVRMLGRQARVIESASATVLLVPDGLRLLVVRLRRGTVPEDRTRRVVTHITSDVLNELPGPRSVAGR